MNLNMDFHMTPNVAPTSLQMWHNRCDYHKNPACVVLPGMRQILRIQTKNEYADSLE